MEKWWVNDRAYCGWYSHSYELLALPTAWTMRPLFPSKNLFSPPPFRHFLEGTSRAWKTIKVRPYGVGIGTSLTDSPLICSISRVPCRVGPRMRSRRSNWNIILIVKYQYFSANLHCANNSCCFVLCVWEYCEYLWIFGNFNFQIWQIYKFLDTLDDYLFSLINWWVFSLRKYVEI